MALSHPDVTEPVKLRTHGGILLPYVVVVVHNLILALLLLSIVAAVALILLYPLTSSLIPLLKLSLFLPKNSTRKVVFGDVVHHMLDWDVSKLPLFIIVWMLKYPTRSSTSLT